MPDETPPIAAEVAATAAANFAAESIDIQLAYLFGAVSQLQAVPAPEAAPDVTALTAAVTRLTAHIFGENG